MLFGGSGILYNGPVPKDPHQSVLVEPPLVIGLSLFPTVYLLKGGLVTLEN